MYFSSNYCEIPKELNFYFKLFNEGIELLNIWINKNRIKIKKLMYTLNINVQNNYKNG